jgi:hypothetical protein
MTLTEHKVAEHIKAAVAREGQSWAKFLTPESRSDLEELYSSLDQTRKGWFTAKELQRAINDAAGRHIRSAGLGCPTSVVVCRCLGNSGCQASHRPLYLPYVSLRYAALRPLHADCSVCPMSLSPHRSAEATKALLHRMDHTHRGAHQGQRVTCHDFLDYMAHIMLTEEPLEELLRGEQGPLLLELVRKGVLSGRHPTAAHT